MNDLKRRFTAGSSTILFTLLALTPHLSHAEFFKESIFGIPQPNQVADSESFDAELFDMDQDGDLDLFIAEGTAGFEGRQNRLLMNLGQGIFQDVSEERLPNMPVPQNNTSSATNDFDQDGDIDIVVANAGPTQLLVNNGKGFFQDMGSELLPPPPANLFDDISSEIGFLDVNADGLADIFITNEIPPIPNVGPGPAPNLLYIQTPDHKFTDQSTARLPDLPKQSLSFTYGDIDGDKDLDIIVSNLGSIDILLNDGKGIFAAQTGPVGHTGRALALGDVNGDGSLDLVLANSNQEQNLIFLNDGNGHFSELKDALPILADTSNDVVLFDIDFDCDLDIIFANSMPSGLPPGVGHPLAPMENSAFLNDGSGHFYQSRSILPKQLFVSFDIELGDVNNDGLTDIVFANADDAEENLLIRKHNKGGKKYCHKKPPHCNKTKHNHIFKK